MAGIGAEWKLTLEIGSFRFCPNADLRDRCCSRSVRANRSFDHLVGALQEGPRHVEAERLRGLEIDDQLKLCRHLQRKIGRLVTLEDAVDVPCRQAKLFAANVTIRYQAARFCKKAIEIDCRHAVAGHQRDDQFTIYIVEHIWHRDEAATWIA